MDLGSKTSKILYSGSPSISRGGGGLFGEKGLGSDRQAQVEKHQRQGGSGQSLF